MSTYPNSAKASLSKSDRIVITGLGAVSPIGNDANTYWENLVAGVSGAALFEPEDLVTYPLNGACEVKDFDPAGYVSRKEARMMARASQFAVAAAHQAVADAGLSIGSDVVPERAAVVINTGGGGADDTALGARMLLQHGPRAVNPFTVTRGMPNAVSASTSLALGTRGPALTATLACASGNYALVEAAYMLERDEADVILTGGTESALFSSYLASLKRLGALSKWPGDPTEASRPFEADRSGFVPGEGAAVVVMEKESHARQRGATIYAEVLGGSLTSDAYHITAPDPNGKGAIRAMRLAIERSGLEAGDVDLIYAHGTSTPLNDATETKAIKNIFGERAYEIPITATKSMIGHTMGAAGAFSALAAVYSIVHGMIPPTINYTTPDPACDLDYVPNLARPAPIQVAMVNAFGFGGHNAVILLRSYEA
jgi:3-oxoacyl-[acyl-carrier-protein] synthase II